MSPTSYHRCASCNVVTSSPGACPTCGRPMEPQAPWACLRTRDNHLVPLLGVALGGEVFGAHARLVLRQRYRNLETKPIEAVYTFPIPGDATLTGFAMECAGRRIEAEVKEREEAFAKYDDAIAKGHGAALLEQERPNVFTASVGNLLPDEETVVEVTFLLRLTADEGALRLMIPTLVAPRYIPGTPAGDRTGHGGAQPTDAVPDADRITPKIADVKYGLAMDLVFDLGRDVTVESPSHAIVTMNDGGMRRRVTFSSKEVLLDRDIVLVAEGAPGVTSGLVCDKRAGEDGTFALTIVPDLFEAKKRSRGRAVVFVVDVSGSMAGASIDQAKRAMRLCMRHLSEGDLFDILPFSSGFSQFSAAAAGLRGRSQEMIPFTQATLKEADAFVDSLVANGGTEMLAPLSAAVKLLEGARRDRVIVLLTDGQVGNDQQIVDEISKAAAGARLYTFGIGTNVSDVLLRGLAKNTKGAVEFIHPGERIDEKVTAQFARATAARVEGIALKWIGADAGEVAPADPPALVDGEPWSVYGRYEVPGTGRVEIRGTLGGEDFFLEIPLDLTDSADRPALTSLWAGARVRDLEEMDASPMGRAMMGRRAEANKKRIVDLCVRYGIASKYASFVVVEKRTGDRRSQGMPETRAVPVNAPAGWAMFRKGVARDEEALFGGKGMGGGGGSVKTGFSDQRDRRVGNRQPDVWAGRPGVPMPMSPRRSAPEAMPRPAAAFAPARAKAPPPEAAPMRAQSEPEWDQLESGGFGPPPPPPAAPGGTYGAPPPPPPGGTYGAPPPSPPGYGAPPAQAAFGAPPPPPPGYGAPPPAEGRAAPAAAPAFGPPGAPPPPMAAPAVAQRPARPIDVLTQRAQEEAARAERSRDEIGAMFERQLASGLWEDGDTTDAGRLAATTACLARCVREGVDTSHPVFGTQVSKAVDALSTVAESLARRGESDAAVIRALLAMAAVSTGKRARGRVQAIVEAAASAAVKAIAADLVSQEAAKKRLG